MEKRLLRKGLIMSSLRNLLVVLGISAALLIPVADAFARGGGGGGRGGGGMGGGGRGGGGMGGGGMGGGGMGGGGMGGGGMGGGGRGGMGGGMGGGTQVPRESATITQDRQDLATWTSTLTGATTAYSNAVRTFTDAFMKQPDYVAAQKDVDDANKELEAARLAVIAKLKASDPTYQAAMQKEAAAKKKLDQIRANGGNRDQIAAQAQLILDAGDAVSKLEADALAKDVKYQEVKKKLADAADKLKLQKDALAEAIKADTSLVALKQTVDDAKTKKDDAQKKLTQDLASGV
jgi:hypothetical protein